jgi:hypothetical protein
MKSVIRVSAWGLCTLVLMGIAGCSTSNDADAARATALGDSGLKTSEARDTAPPPQNQREWMERKGDPYAGYPGSKTSSTTKKR